MSTEPFWAVVDFMGHQRLAGRVSEVQRFGVTMMQIEIPQEDGTIETRLRGGGSIYELRPCSEEEARRVAEALRPKPYTPPSYQLPPLSPPIDADFDDEDEPAIGDEPSVDERDDYEEGGIG